MFSKNYNFVDVINIHVKDVRYFVDLRSDHLQSDETKGVIRNYFSEQKKPGCEKFLDVSFDNDAKRLILWLGMQLENIATWNQSNKFADKKLSEIRQVMLGVAMSTGLTTSDFAKSLESTQGSFAHFIRSPVNLTRLHSPVGMFEHLVSILHKALDTDIKKRVLPKLGKLKKSAGNPYDYGDAELNFLLQSFTLLTHADDCLSRINRQYADKESKQSDKDKSALKALPFEKELLALPFPTAVDEEKFYDSACVWLTGKLNHLDGKKDFLFDHLSAFSDNMKSANSVFTRKEKFIFLVSELERCMMKVGKPELHTELLKIMIQCQYEGYLRPYVHEVYFHPRKPVVNAAEENTPLKKENPKAGL